MREIKEMKMRVIAGLLLALASLPAAAQQRPWPEHLIDLWGKAEDLCRGVSGDDPQSPALCDVRNDIVRRLNSYGACYGLPGQVSAEMRWHWCEGQPAQARPSSARNVPPETPDRAALRVRDALVEDRMLALSAFQAAYCGLRTFGWAHGVKERLIAQGQQTYRMAMRASSDPNAFNRVGDPIWIRHFQAMNALTGRSFVRADTCPEIRSADALLAQMDRLAGPAR